MTTFRSYQELLDYDQEPPPAAFRLRPGLADGPTEVPAAVYVSRDYHELEKREIWLKSWQVACREEHVRHAGDQYVYRIVDRSYLIVRGDDDVIRAFPNACLHRGRQLRDYSGNARDIRCPFHAIAWRLDGSLLNIPCAQDFKQYSAEDWRLETVQVEAWGGFVFIKPSSGGESLAGYLGALDTHFEPWPLEERYLARHIVKKQRCNWKVAQEAFMESYHVASTHPQLLWFSGDGELTQHDVFGNFSRAIMPRGVPSPHLKSPLSEQEMLDGLLTRFAKSQRPMLAGGETARSAYAAAMREELRPTIGSKADKLSCAELCDAVFYTVFPNFHPWGAYFQSVYIFRPNGDDHETSLMELMFLAPFSGSRPPPAACEELDFDDSWVDSVGPRGRVFDQDSLNMPQVHLGLKQGVSHIRLASEQEIKLRHFYKLYFEKLGLSETRHMRPDLQAKGRHAAE